MKLKLKPEFADTKLVRGSNIIYTKDIKEEDYELYYKRYPGIFEIVNEPIKKNVISSAEEKAEKAITRLEEFFHSLEINTKLSEYTEDFAGTAEKIERTFTDRNWVGLGENKNLTPKDVYKIVEMSY